MNREHESARPGNDLLAARIGAYELAARMQTSVPRGRRARGREPGDASSFTAWTTPRAARFARNCLLARRLLERGVRFVQLFRAGRP